VVPQLVLALVAVALVAVVIGVAKGRVPVDPLSDPVGSTPDTGLPEVPTAADVDAVRFDTEPRGYHIDDVDTRLDVLHETLAQREVELAGLLDENRPEEA
jgi:DivIVA domain-containing protein